MTQHLVTRRGPKLLSLIFMTAAALALPLGWSGSAGAAPTLVPRPSALAVADFRMVPVLQAAGTVLGHPYRWGGTAPGGFDCSGLVRWSFAQAGIALPRDSRGQRAVTMPISEGELVPGDLVFYGSPVHHVGIYMGDGLMVHSPRAGDVVKVAPIHRFGSSPSGFGRVK